MKTTKFHNQWRVAYYADGKCQNVYFPSEQEAHDFIDQVNKYRDSIRWPWVTRIKKRKDSAANYLPVGVSLSSEWRKGAEGSMVSYQRLTTIVNGRVVRMRYYAEKEPVDAALERLYHKANAIWEQRLE